VNFEIRSEPRSSLLTYNLNCSYNLPALYRTSENLITNQAVEQVFWIPRQFKVAKIGMVFPIITHATNICVDLQLLRGKW
jgi:hypothetical protein